MVFICFCARLLEKNITFQTYAKNTKNWKLQVKEEDYIFLKQIRITNIENHTQLQSYHHVNKDAGSFQIQLETIAKKQLGAKAYEDHMLSGGQKFSLFYWIYKAEDRRRRNEREIQQLELIQRPKIIMTCGLACSKDTNKMMKISLNTHFYLYLIEMCGLDTLIKTRGLDTSIKMQDTWVGSNNKNIL